VQSGIEDIENPASRAPRSEFPLNWILSKGALCENKKITPSFTTGMAKPPHIWVGNPDALYRDFSPNYFKDILCFHTISK